MPYWETICIVFFKRCVSSSNFLSDRFKRLMLFTNFNFLLLLNTAYDGGRWPTVVVVGALFRCASLNSVAFAVQRKSSVCSVARQDFCIFLWFLYQLRYVDDVCKPNIQKVRYTTRDVVLKSVGTAFSHEIKRKIAPNSTKKEAFAYKNFHTGSSRFTVNFWRAVRICASLAHLWYRSHVFTVYNPNHQVTLLVYKGVGTPFSPQYPLYKTGKTLTDKSCFNLIKTIGCLPHPKVLQNIWNLDRTICMPLCSPTRLMFYFFSVCCSPQK